MSEEDLAAAFYRHGGKEGLKYMKQENKTEKAHSQELSGVLDVARAAEFDLEKWKIERASRIDQLSVSQWDAAYKGLEAGFHKGSELERERILDLVLKKAKLEQPITIDELEQIINKLKSPRPDLYPKSVSEQEAGELFDKEGKE